MKRPGLLLGGLLVVLAGVLAYNYLPDWWRSRLTPRGPDGLDSETALDLPALDFSRLDRHAMEELDAGRNLFVFTEPPPTQEELDRQRREEEERRRREAEARRLAEEREQERRKRERERQQEMREEQATPPERRPTPPQIPFKLRGYLGSQQNQIAVLQQGKELFLGQEGDVLLEEFKIVEVGYSTITVGFTRFTETQVLQLEN